MKKWRPECTGTPDVLRLAMKGNATLSMMHISMNSLYWAVAGNSPARYMCLLWTSNLDLCMQDADQVEQPLHVLAIHSNGKACEI